jgi:branched-subunit amino acid transport protein
MEQAFDNVHQFLDIATPIVMAGVFVAGLIMTNGMAKLEAKLTGAIAAVKETLLAHNTKTEARLLAHEAKDDATFEAIKDSLSRIERMKR